MRRRLILAAAVLAAAALNGAAAAKADAVDRAEQALRAGDVRGALAALQQRLAAVPDDAQALRALGVVELKLGRAGQAERSLRAALAAGMPEPDLAAPLAQAMMLQDRAEALLLSILPGDRPADSEGEVRFWRALAHAALNESEAALASLDDAARLLPGDPRPAIAKAQQLIALRRLDEAGQAAEMALQRARLPDQRAEALVLKGDLRRMAGEPEAAERLFAEALLTDPESRGALIGRATLALGRGDGDEAERQARRVLAMTPDHPVARYLLAASQAARNHVTAALATLHDAEDKAYPPSLLLRATLRLNRGELELARHDIEHYQAVAGPDAGSQRLRGALLLRLREPERAVAVLRDAAEGDPGDMQTAALLAAALVLAGDLPAAARVLDSDSGLKAVDELTRQMPDSPLPPTLAGTVLAGRGDPDAARTAFQRALAVDGNFIPALLSLAKLEMTENRPEESRRLLLQVLAIDPGHVGAMSGMAELSGRLGRLDTALEWLDRAVAAAPESLTARLDRIAVLLRGGDVTAAWEAAQALAAQAPDDPAVLEALGTAAWALGDRDAALDAFRRLAAAAPDSPKALMLLAAALAGQDRLAEAVEVATAAAALDDDHLPAQAQRLQFLIAAGRGGEAVAAAQAWRARHPGQTAGDLLLADIQLRAGHAEDAVTVLEGAFARRPSTPLALQLAEARLRAGTAEAAAAGLGDWLALHPEQIRVRSALASLHLRLGRHAEAEAGFEAVAAADAGDAVALNNLAWLYHRRGDGRALATAEQAYRLQPDSPQIADTLGTILIARRDTRRGLALLRQAHAGAPRAPEIRYHLAEALAQAGETDEARRLLDELVGENVEFEEAAAARALRDSLGGGG